MHESERIESRRKREIVTKSTNKLMKSMKADGEHVRPPGFFKVVVCLSLQSACRSVSYSLF